MNENIPANREERLVVAHLRRQPHPVCQWCRENEAWVQRVKALEDLVTR